MLFLNPALAADCVQVGNLTWEVKTDDGGLRDKDNRYFWYDTLLVNNNGNPGQLGQVGQGCTGNISCDTKSYMQAVNAQNLCGHGDWRMPTWEEMQSLINRNNSPTIDLSLFPNTVNGAYWTAATHADDNGRAWYIDFGSGNEQHDFKSLASYVRLVRGDKAAPRCVTLGALMWEVKSGRGTLQAFDNRYTWYNTLIADNNGAPGTQRQVGQGCTGAVQCDTQHYSQTVFY